MKTVTEKAIKFQKIIFGVMFLSCLGIAAVHAKNIDYKKYCQEPQAQCKEPVKGNVIGLIMKSLS